MTYCYSFLLITNYQRVISQYVDMYVLLNKRLRSLYFAHEMSDKHFIIVIRWERNDLKEQTQPY